MTETRLDRRSVLALAGAAVTALAGCTDGGYGGGNGTGDDGQGPTTIELGGETAGWTGRAPASIEGTTNPTLQLTVGQTYELTWENLDGVEHELIIENGDGKQLAATESASQTGATRSLTFTANEEMASYYCEYHPQSMRGDVAVDSGG